MKVKLAPTEVDMLISWLLERSLTCPKRDIILTQSHASGIGVSSFVKCGCGIEKDITDYNLW